MNYTSNQTAQGLASLGRGNDSMLVHMTPREVQGLQGLAMAHGGSLTVNPETGLPEAGFLDAVLPMAAGFALGPGGFGLFSSPLMAGLAVGGITALTSGDLGKGVMAGLGAGSGASLGNIFSKMGTQSVGGIPAGAAQDAIKSAAIQDLPANVAQNAASNLGMFNSQGATAAMGAAGNAIPGAGLSNFNNLGLSSQTIGPGVNSAVNTMGAAPTSTQIAESTLSQPLSGFGSSAKGFGKFMEDPLGKGFEAFKEAGGEAGKPLTSGEATMKLGSPIASLALSGMEPPTYEGYEDPDKNKWRGPQGQLNLSGSSGLRLAEGGTINTGGIRDLYGNRDDQLGTSLSTDGYGLGRLSNLANEQAMTQAQTRGYADGGNVGMNLNELPTLNVNTGSNSSADLAGLKQLNPIGALFNVGLGGRLGKDIQVANDPESQRFFYGDFVKFGDDPQTQAFARFANTGKLAKGGYLNGDGDGMSDSIPATIDGKQPARLADGEFVVPADVVSHLGNGSSKAGSKRLYAMLDKVRQARTGTKKQGKEIKAEKYMPA